MLAGIEKPIMEESEENKWLEWVENTLVTDVKILLHTIKAGIHMFEQWQPRLQRIQDSFIMDHVPDEIGEKEAKQINRCRMYLHALTVSDIATSDGKELDRGALRGIKIISFESVHKWSQQKTIYNQGWKEWKLFLVKHFCDAGTYNLKIPLGD